MSDSKKAFIIAICGYVVLLTAAYIYLGTQ